MEFDVLADVVQSLVQVWGDCEPGNNVDLCPGAVLHPVTAALATQGYWAQSEVLWYLTFTGLEVWALLIYLLALIGGIVSFALGAPPKFWLWFLIGPGMYHQLIQDTVPAMAVRWFPGPGTPDFPDRETYAMQEMWKLAEAGLANSTAVASSTERSDRFFRDPDRGYNIYADRNPTGRPDNGDMYAGDPPGTVRVSQLFKFYDALLTDTVLWFIQFSGLYNSGASRPTIATDTSSSNLPPAGLTQATGLSFLGVTIVGTGSDTDRSDDITWLMSRNKWKYLEAITGATLHSGDLRDAFIYFLTSECGDAFTRGINESNFVHAATSKGINIPDTVFVRNEGSAVGPFTLSNGAKYGLVTQLLSSKVVPTPGSVQSLFAGDHVGSFRRSYKQLRDAGVAATFFNDSGILETIRCDDYLQIIVDGFRWEAAHAYYQLIIGLPPGTSPLTLMYTLFYGWPIRVEPDDLISGLTAGASDILQGIGINIGFFTNELWNVIGANAFIGTPEQQKEFMVNLIFVHMVKNEMEFAPKPYERRTNSGAEAEANVESYQAQVGSKNKYGEFYTWTKLIPYVQGVIFYLLAIAYPFAAMFMLVPGYHKGFFTWMSFWAWAKIWDIGFAIVLVLERSIWAMVGNSADHARVFSRIMTMTGFGGHDIDCPSGSATSVAGLAGLVSVPYTVCRAGITPEVAVGTPGGGITLPGGLPPITIGGGIAAEQSDWYDTMQFIDQAMVLSGSLQLDLSNSYYVYVMTALYFAVPAVTGQIVLSGKGALAGISTSALGGAASEIGRAAGQGHVGDLTNRIDTTGSAVGQGAYAKEQRRSGYAMAALDAGNSALMSGSMGRAASTAQTALGQQSRVTSLNREAASSRADSISARDNLGAQSIGLGAEVGSTLTGKAAQHLPGLSRGGNRSAQNGAMSGGGGQQQSGAIADTGAAALGSASRNAGSLVSSKVGLNSAAAKEAYTLGNHQAQVEYDAGQSGAAVDGFYHGSTAAGQQLSQSRLGAAAEFSGQTASFEARKNYGRAHVGKAAALGVSAGVLSPGSRPTNMEGMAMTGMLGSEAQSKARFGTDTGAGSYQDWVNGTTSDLNSNYGYNATKSLYQPPSLGDVQSAGDTGAANYTSGSPVLSTANSASKGSLDAVGGNARKGVGSTPNRSVDREKSFSKPSGGNTVAGVNFRKER